MPKVNKEQINYTGKIVYIGIDVHKKTYSVTCLCDGVVVKRATLRANPEGLIKFLKKYFTGATLKSAYEAGFSGFILHRCLLKT